MNKKEVLRIAELAKIDINKKDVAGYQKDLEATLEFVGTLSELPDLSEDEYRQIMRKEDTFRKDEEHGTMSAKGQGLIDQAPKHRNNFVVSPHTLTEKDDA